MWQRTIHGSASILIHTVYAPEEYHESRSDIKKSKQERNHASNPDECDDNGKKEGGRSDAAVLRESSRGFVLCAHCKIADDTRKYHHAKEPCQARLQGVVSFDVLTVMGAIVVEDAFENGKLAQSVGIGFEFGKIAFRAGITLDTVQETRAIVVHYSRAMQFARLLCKIIVECTPSFHFSHRVGVDAQRQTRKSENAKQHDRMFVHHSRHGREDKLLQIPRRTDTSQATVRSYISSTRHGAAALVMCITLK